MVNRLPHTMDTKVHAIQLLNNGYTINYVARKYHVSERTLYRWLKKYDGTKESLENKSHRPLTPDKKSYTQEEINNIIKYVKRNPDCFKLKIWYKLKKKCNYKRSPSSFYYVCNRLFGPSENKKKKKKVHNGRYNTPVLTGVKMQIDVKRVPNKCKSSNIPKDEKFYQYTAIDEASRKRFLYSYKEQSSYSTCDFVKRAVKFFGYVPKIIQTDNGGEFTHNQKNTKMIHPLDVLCNELQVKHQLIRPRTPEHNGKVERSHRTDSEEFYSKLKFYSYEDLQNQLKKWNYRYNNTPMRTLKYKTPNEKENEIKIIKNIAKIFSKNDLLLLPLRV